MNQYWVDINGDNESFWEHEWDKHGTCMTTIRPTCLPSGSTTGTDAAYYFQRAVDTFQSLPTYQYLSAAGITPSSSNTYTYTTLANAIKASTGYTPSLDCTSSTLNQISYYFNLKGSLIDGTLVPIDAPSSGSCPSSGIKYPPKSGGSTGTTTTTSSSPTGTAAPSKSTITATTSSGSSVGCLLSAGTWSTQTCATLTATTSGSGFTLTSSKGKCAISSSGLTCSSSVTTASVFTVTSSGGSLLLTYSGSTAFTADSVPSGTTQVTLYAGSARAQDVTLVMHAV
ncbi:ribonuclease T2-like [Tulasnella sp. 425]|nr:ribonuclease T2-like [Tulasnella sp. 425]